MEDKNIIRDRLSKLRRLMEEQKIDFYYITTSDYHNSEYLDDYFKEREFMSGFTGSNGNLLVEKERAGLWTDGRYFIQAEQELAGTGITLYKIGEPGVASTKEYLSQQMKEGEVLALDGRTINGSLGEELEALVKEKKGSLLYETDLVDEIWQDRPLRKAQPVLSLDEGICGKTVSEKLTDVRKEMEKKKASVFVLGRLDDIMWLFNIRGTDVECNPVALSYAVITAKDCVLFLQDKAVSEDMREWEKTHSVKIASYDGFMDYIRNVPWEGSALLDCDNISYTVYKLVKEKTGIIRENNPTLLLKAKKNETELHQMRQVYLRDSLAVCRFMKWLKENIKRQPITELSAAEYMDSLRRNTPGFLDLSFPTICGYGKNAAMMHYQATSSHYDELLPEGMLLVDSGGQYLGGTTDVTRTFALGAVSREIKTHFTAVVVGMLRLLNARFLQGCTGRNLDILAREPLWNLGIDYKCGTGHGIGYILNVHEGPQSIHWRYREGMKETVLEEGMVLSNEPGVYVEGSHGIRIENIMVAREDVSNGDGQFMGFECLTFVPIDLELIESSLMDERDRENLNRYHRQVYEKISPLMEEEEKQWLKRVCAPLTTTV